ncbi:threonine dehydrogenase-like Zn-dependent dehydrogenase [Amorphus suaedae]
MTGDTPTTASALWYSGSAEAEIRTEELAGLPPGAVRVRALASGISRGTERLVFLGDVPESEYERMRAPFQAGDFPGPVKYGYASVGLVEAGPDALLGRRVFALHPHQTHYDVPADAVAALPDDLPTDRAVLAANMETALNAVWDSGLGPGDRVTVVGGGVLGLLVARLAVRTPGTEVTVLDADPDRHAIAERFGASFALPRDAEGDRDIVFHTSASGTGFDTAVRLCGVEAKLVELSWYGTKPVLASLGGAFHSRRLTLQSSQVGSVSPGRRVRWSHARRLAKALELLCDPVLDELLDTPIAFTDLPARLSGMLAIGGGFRCPVVHYPARDASEG